MRVPSRLVKLKPLSTGGPYIKQVASVTCPRSRNVLCLQTHEIDCLASGLNLVPPDLIPQQAKQNIWKYRHPFLERPAEPPPPSTSHHGCGQPPFPRCQRARVKFTSFLESCTRGQNISAGRDSGLMHKSTNRRHCKGFVHALCTSMHAPSRPLLLNSSFRRPLVAGTGNRVSSCRRLDALKLEHFPNILACRLVERPEKGWLEFGRSESWGKQASPRSVCRKCRTGCVDSMCSHRNPC